LSNRVIKSEDFVALYSPSGSATSSPGKDGAYVSPRVRLTEMEAELARVRAEMETRIAEAHEHGRDEARRQAHDEFGLAAQALQAAAAEFQASARAGRELAEEEIITLAIAVAGKILRREIATDEDFVARLVRRCLRLIVRRSHVHLRVHPRDYPRILPLKESLAQDAGAGHEILIHEDRRVDRGGCIVETPDFVIDGTLRSQLREAHSALEGDSP
jgi:flagellar assembly protein FliH